MQITVNVCSKRWQSIVAGGDCQVAFGTILTARQGSIGKKIGYIVSTVPVKSGIGIGLD